MLDALFVRRALVFRDLEPCFGWACLLAEREVARCRFNAVRSTSIKFIFGDDHEGFDFGTFNTFFNPGSKAKQDFAIKNYCLNE